MPPNRRSLPLLAGLFLGALLVTGPTSTAAAANATATATTARGWSYVCMCAVEEYAAGCLADANRLCARPDASDTSDTSTSDPSDTSAFRLSEGSCAEAAAGTVGYFLLHEMAGALHSTRCFYLQLPYLQQLPA